MLSHHRKALFLFLSPSLLVWAQGCADQETDQAPVIVTVVERAETDVVTDIGDPGDSVGDILTFANPLFDASNTTQVGTDQGYCVRVEVGKSWECFWTAFLAEGQLTVEGPFFDAGDSVLAITGGTDQYSNASGQMKLHFRNPQGTEFDFTYEIE